MDNKHDNTDSSSPIAEWVIPFEKRAANAIGSGWFLSFVLILAMSLRLAHVLILKSTPFFKHLQLDHSAYEKWALAIQKGDWIGTKLFFVDPLYAYFLAGVYTIFGQDLLAVRILQVGIGTATCWLTAILGRRVLDSKALGNVAAFAVAVSAPCIFFDAAIEKTSLALFLFTLSLMLFFGKKLRTIFASGIVLGLGVLTRGTFLTLILAGTFALMFPWRKDPSRPPNTNFWCQQRVKRAALFFIGAMLTISIATVRNFTVSGEFVLVTTNFGQNLYLGHHSGQTPTAPNYPDFVRPDTRYEEIDFHKEAERRLGRTLTAKETSAYWMKQGISKIVSAPLVTAEYIRRNFRLFWHNYEIQDNENIDIIADYSAILRLPLVHFGIFFPFALLGTFVGWRHNRRIRLLATAVAIYCAGVLVFFVLAKLRIQMITILAVLAVPGGLWFWKAATRKKILQLSIGCFVWLVAASYSLIYPDWIDANKTRGRAIAYHNLGSLFIDAGNQEAALKAHKQAVAIQPSSVIASLRTLGELYLGRGEFTKAEEYMQQVLMLRPKSQRGRNALIRLYQTMLKDPTHAGDTSIQIKLDKALRKTSTYAPLKSRTNGMLFFKDQYVAIMQTLALGPQGSPVWFAIDNTNEDARILGHTLRDAFMRAGWDVRGFTNVPFRMKSGVFLFAAERNPSENVHIAHNALQAAGIAFTYGTGYQAYTQEMKQKNPNWRGFDMVDGQAYIIVIGRNPLAANNADLP